MQSLCQAARETLTVQHCLTLMVPTTVDSGVESDSMNTHPSDDYIIRTRLVFPKQGSCIQADTKMEKCTSDAQIYICMTRSSFEQ